MDLRAHNSWRLTLAEVPTLELLEVLLVNATAPFVMTARLKGLMLRAREAPAGTATSRDPAKHVVLVSAMEGQFYREHKTDRHPHTNMAKAALNMIVRTSAPDYARDGIYLNAVDTGWVTDEDPAHLAERKVEEHAFSPRSTSSTARPASSPRSSTGSGPGSTRPACSSRTTGRRPGSADGPPSLPRQRGRGSGEGAERAAPEPSLAIPGRVRP